MFLKCKITENFRNIFLLFSSIREGKIVPLQFFYPKSMKRDDFPILDRQVNGQPLVYFDNAATTQKPSIVINSLIDYYEKINSNVHRGNHWLSHEATMAMEEARETVRSFINASETSEIVFTRGTTEAINLIASSYGKRFLHQGDEVLISEMEHHSNIVPWQIACENYGAQLKVVPFDECGVLDLQALENLLSDKTRIVAVTHVSNTLGTINPIAEIVKIAHRKNVPVMVDGAQGIAHESVDVRSMDCDFYCFSGHKMYAPTGIGILYGKKKWLEEMPPYQGGGEMIQTVTFARTTYNELPFKFEAGTPNIADIMGLKAAIDYVREIGMENIAAYEQELLHYATERLEQIEGLVIIGKAARKASLISFNLKGIHPSDVGILLDQQGVAVRTGHHCTQPIMDKLGIPGTVRASFSFYNTKEEIDKMIVAIKKAKLMLS